MNRKRTFLIALALATTLPGCARWEGSREPAFEEGFSDTPASVYGDIRYGGTDPSSLQRLRYELVDSRGVVAWRCAEGPVRNGGQRRCSLFPVPTHAPGTFTLLVHYVSPHGAREIHRAPLEVSSRMLGVLVWLSVSEEHVVTSEVNAQFEAPAGVSLAIAPDGEGFQLVNASAFDLVVEGYDSAFAGYVPLFQHTMERCGTCGTGIRSFLVRRGTTFPAAPAPCMGGERVLPPGRYAATVGARVRAPGLPVYTPEPPDCERSATEPFVVACGISEPVGDVSYEEMEQLESVVVWTEFQLLPNGHVSEADPGVSFPEWRTASLRSRPTPRWRWDVD